MNREIITTTEDETRLAGIRLGSKSNKGDIIALSGDLGTGKTVMAKGIARGMGISEEITSPTFTLLEIYEGVLNLYHFDLYRIKSTEELDQLYFEEYWNGDGVSVIEWPERCGTRLPDNKIMVRLEYIDENRRKITIEYPDI